MEHDSSNVPKGITFRCIIIGLVLTPVTIMFLVSTEVMWQSGYPSILSLMYHVVFILVWLVLFNLLLKRYKPEWALSPGELLVIYTMLSIGSALAGHDMLQVLTPSISHLYHHYHLTGRFDEIIPHVPEWLVVQDRTALDSAYGGQESMFDPRNYRPWLLPLAWWTGFVIALCAVMWGLNLLLRKQWTENEKLSYPILQVPMLLADAPMKLLRSKAFWIAFSIAAGINFLNGLNVLYPTIPGIPIVQVTDIQNYFPERPWSDMGSMPVSFYPFAIGMCFFMPLDLAFSSWFFYLFWKVQRVLASHMGMHGMPGFPYVEEQVAGGYYAIALIALWFGRSHIRRTFEVLVGRESETITPYDRIESRLSFGLMGAGGLFLVWFCLHAGMSLGITLMFFLLYYLVAIGVTRIRAELGPPTVDTYGISPHLQIIRIFGAGELTRANETNVAMFGLLSGICRTSRTHPMPHGLEGFRIAERLKLDNVRYFIAMWVAIIAGIICSFGAMLFVLNKYGASAQILGIPEPLGEEAWSRVQMWMTAPERWHAAPIWAIAIGMLSVLGMTLLRSSLTWWPFMPAGYVMSGVRGASMDLLWMSVFIAWLVKLLLLKYGGPNLYRPAVPFFIGLVLGDFMMGSFWNLYGTLFGVRVYHFWPY